MLRPAAVCALPTALFARGICLVIRGCKIELHGHVEFGILIIIEQDALD